PDHRLEYAVPVAVRLPAILRPAAEGEAVVRADGSTVGEVFADVVRKHPALESQLLTPEGQLHRHLNVFLNDDDIRYLGKLDAKVGGDDTLTLMPAVAGG
ncbi:MAG TPA: ubiquitin-like small modifier protein 1, partial [Acidimicrobiales bacterium]|nr:ubiquitin-like small modifier protein 1 [Acidimicrobiales bacterium]